MTDASATIKQCEDQIEEALWSLEVPGETEKALVAYRDAETKLEALAIAAGQPAYAEQQRVLAYCLLRQGNILRQMERSQEALTLGEREIESARLSCDNIVLGRSLMSNGANCVVAGNVKKGLELLEEARVLFESGDSYDHQQGLGWLWVLQADLTNARLVEGEPSRVVEMADRALAILLPIENWPGVARACAARGQAHERRGDTISAAADREAQHRYKSMVEREEGSGG